MLKYWLAVMGLGFGVPGTTEVFRGLGFKVEEGPGVVRNARLGPQRRARLS